MSRTALRILPLWALLQVLPLAAAPGDDDAGQQIARANRYIEQWRFEEAAALAESLLARHPGRTEVQYLAGKAKFLLQDYAGAEALLTRATAERPAEAPPDPWLEWARQTRKITADYVVVPGGRFELRVPRGADQVLIPYAVEALDAAWQNVGEDFEWFPERPVVVEAYLTAEELSAASGLPVEAIKTSGTIAICKHNKLMFTSPQALLRGYEWLDTLTHEYVHYVVSRASHNTVPVWLHEGLAKFEETRWNGEAGRALSPYSETLLAEAVQGKRDFVTFAEMYPSMALLPSQEHTALAFAEVFSAVEYLVGELGGYPAVRRIVGALKDGRSDGEAIAAGTGMDFTAFETAWRRWLKKRPLRAMEAAQPETLTFKSDVAGKVPEGAEDEGDPAEDMAGSQGQRHAHLGELLRMRGRNRAAVVEYEKAYATSGPEAPLLSNKLALTYMGLERYDEAEKVLAAAREANPAFVTTHVNLGRLYQRTERGEAAETAYLRANEINPFDPAIHAGLHALYQARGDTVRAEREARAVALVSQGPQRPRPGATDTDTGFLTLHTTRWARVVLDGEQTGLTTPLYRHALPAGTHTLELVLPDGTRQTVEVEIAAGETLERSVSLAPAP